MPRDEYDDDQCSNVQQRCDCCGHLEYSDYMSAIDGATVCLECAHFELERIQDEQTLATSNETSTGSD
jgi:hypothetical protein